MYKKIKHWNRQKNHYLRVLKLNLVRLFLDKKPREPFNPHDIKKVLILRDDNKIGDMIVSSGLFKSLHDSGRYVGVVAGKDNGRIIAKSENVDKQYYFVKNKAIVEKCDYFSHVVYWDQKIIDMLPAVWRIRRQKPQLAVLLHSKQPYDVLSAVMSGCEFILRDNYSPQPMGMEQWFANYSRAYDGHLIQRKMKLVSSLGCATDNISMFVPAPFTPIVRDREKKIVAFQMGASNQLRCWPVSRFVELAKLILATDQSYSIALIGTSKERELAESFLMAFAPAELARITNYVGSTSLIELLAYIDSFDVLVTGDTGPLHLAIALKTPTVSLFATANPASTGPLQDPELHQVIKINVEDIFFP